MKRKLWYWIFPLVGILFCLNYIRISTCNVVYSDYIRLINSYLPDVWNPDKFLVPDILTRIPVNFLVRIINVELFGFSMQFDRVMGIIGLGLSGWLLGHYCLGKRISLWWFGAVSFLIFGLNKWEMLINGTGWVHFFAFALFYYHYLVFDRVRHGGGKKGDHILLYALPFVITLGFAGPYCAIYSATLILAYGFCMVCDCMEKKKPDRRMVLQIVCIFIPLVLYFISNSLLTEDYDKNSVSTAFLPTLLGEPKFMLEFFLKSFGSMVLGRETAEAMVSSGMPDKFISLLGLLVIGAYLLALWLNFSCAIYKKTLFPLMLLASGGMNHVLILLSRWIFHIENYGMSSRYALQYQVGIIGIILTFALAFSRIRVRWRRGAILAVCLMFLAGNVVTTADELKKAPYRKAHGQELMALVMKYGEEGTLSDEELSRFEYTRGNEKVLNALRIIKENNLNVFYQRDGGQ